MQTELTSRYLIIKFGLTECLASFDPVKCLSVTNNIDIVLVNRRRKEYLSSIIF
jgi:hypothetical protein